MFVIVDPQITFNLKKLYACLQKKSHVRRSCFTNYSRQIGQTSFSHDCHAVDLLSATFTETNFAHYENRFMFKFWNIYTGLLAL